MKKILLLAIIMMATVTSAMAQGTKPYVMAIADGDTNVEGNLNDMAAAVIMLCIKDVIIGETVDGTVYYTNPATGKHLFWMEGAGNDAIIHLCDGVTPADKITYTFTEQEMANYVGTKYEGYTGITLTFCTETITTTLSHWQLFSPADGEAAFVMMALTMDEVIEIDDKSALYTDVETNQRLCYQLIDDPESETIRIAISRGLTAPKTYNHDLSLDFRLSLADDEEMLSQMQVLTGRDPREIRTVNLTLDPTDIPTNPTIDWSLNVTDGMNFVNEDMEVQIKLYMIGAAILDAGLLTIDDDNNIFNTEGKKLGSMSMDEESIIIYIAEGVNSDDDVVMELDDEMRDGYAYLIARAQIPAPFDPFTMKTVSIRFPASSGIEAVDGTQTATRRFFTIDGTPIPDMPTHKGLYIVGGKKVVIK